MVAPFYYGNYRLGYWGENNFHGHSFYAGIVPLFAAILAIPLCWKNRWVPRLVIFILVLAVIAAGRFLPVYHLLYKYVPLFDSMRNPSRFFGLVQFAIALLGAIALQGLMESKRVGIRLPLISIIVAVVLIAVLIGSLVQLAHLVNDPSPAVKFIRSLPNLKEREQTERIDNVRTMSRLVMSRMDSVTWIGIAAAVLSIAACTGMVLLGIKLTASIGWILVALLVLDLGMFSGGMLHYIEVDKGNILAVVTEVPEHTRYLQENLGVQRYLCWGWWGTNLDRFRGMQFRIRHTIINRGGTFHTPRQWKTILSAWNKNRRIMNLLGIRYLVTNNPVRGNNTQLAYRKGDVYITENQSAFPLAFLARRLRVFDDPNEVFREITRGDLNLRDVALLEEQIAPLPPVDPNTDTEKAGTVVHVSDLPGEYLIRTSADGPRQLVLTETHHPQWRCTIDGTATPVYLTNYTFMSVRVPPGEHEVRWWFEPVQFKRGLTVTLAALILTAGAFAFAGVRYYRRRRGGAIESPLANN